MTNPRLLIILNRFVIGGQAVDTIPLAYYLKNDFEILIIYGEKEIDEIEPVFLLQKYEGLTLKKIKELKRSINPFTDVFAFIKILSVVLNFKPDIVHTHGAKTGILGRLAAFFCRVPVIVHTFHGHFFHSYFSKGMSSLVAAVERGMTQITTAVVALSEMQRQDLVDVFKVVSNEKLQIIPLGFDALTKEEPHIYRERFRKTYALDEDVVAIGIVGRIVAVKNHQLFLRIAEKILAGKPSSRLAFFIIGDGDLRPFLEQYLIKKKIAYSTDKYSDTKKIIFTSWLTNMEEIMNGLDIVALTSLNEGTPLTLIEAQYFQKPVVCTNVGGVKDTIEDQKTGFLVESENVDAFVDKLNILIENKALRQLMGSAGKELVTKKFSKQNEVSAYRHFYFSLLNKKKFFNN
ncbi:MAG TPA: glycosyltransferase [Segetibacter sp.]